jgi:5-methylcytosine-specific restriction endonuclease McrA
MPPRVVRTRATGTWTEAKYFGFIRNALRDAFRKYPVKHHAKNAAKEMTKKGVRYRCADCEELFASQEVHVDHIIPCGSLKNYDDLPGFVERMFCEVDNFQVLCKPCHQIKTNAETTARRAANAAKKESKECE